MKSFISFGGKEVEVNTFGTGKTIVFLLAGWTHNFQHERKFIGELVKKSRVVTFSYPGYSQSETNSEAQSMNFLADLADRVIRSQKIKLTDLTLVGFSMGCQVALHYLKRSNGKVRKVVLISPVLYSLWNDLPYYGRALLSSSLLINISRNLDPLKRFLINKAYSSISSITEGRPGNTDFNPKDVTLNGAFDTLVATLTFFVDPVDFKSRIKFVFGEREIAPNYLVKLGIKHWLIKNSGHRSFDNNYKQFAKLVLST